MKKSFIVFELVQTKPLVKLKCSLNYYYQNWPDPDCFSRIESESGYFLTVVSHSRRTFNTEKRVDYVCRYI